MIQPDVVHAGGIAETLAIAAMAETWMVPVAPHNPNGPVATAATLVVDAIAPNALIQEMLTPWDADWRDAVVEGESACRGRPPRDPDRPGLGVRLVPEEIARHPYQPVNSDFFGSASVLETVDLAAPHDDPTTPGVARRNPVERGGARVSIGPSQGIHSIAR